MTWSGCAGFDLERQRGRSRRIAAAGLGANDDRVRARVSRIRRVVRRLPAKIESLTRGCGEGGTARSRPPRAPRRPTAGTGSRRRGCASGRCRASRPRAPRSACRSSAAPSGATFRRISLSRCTTLAPGHSVYPVNRCGTIVGTLHFGSRVEPRIVAAGRDQQPATFGFTWATSSRQARTRRNACCIFGLGRVCENVPSSETENARVLNPCCAAPITGSVTPPDRPSYARPYLSTRKL